MIIDLSLMHAMDAEMAGERRAEPRRRRRLTPAEEYEVEIALLRQLAYFYPDDGHYPQ